MLQSKHGRKKGVAAEPARPPHSLLTAASPTPEAQRLAQAPALPPHQNFNGQAASGHSDRLPDGLGEQAGQLCGPGRLVPSGQLGVQGVGFGLGDGGDLQPNDQGLRQACCEAARTWQGAELGQGDEQGFSHSNNARFRSAQRMQGQGDEQGFSRSNSARCRSALRQRQTGICAQPPT